VTRVIGGEDGGSKEKGVEDEGVGYVAGEGVAEERSRLLSPSSCGYWLICSL
jgi:hypothetical protein